MKSWVVSFSRIKTLYNSVTGSSNSVEENYSFAVDAKTKTDAIAAGYERINREWGNHPVTFRGCNLLESSGSEISFEEFMKAIKENTYCGGEYGWVEYDEAGLKSLYDMMSFKISGDVKSKNIMEGN